MRILGRMVSEVPLICQWHYHLADDHQKLRSELRRFNLYRIPLK